MPQLHVVVFYDAALITCCFVMGFVIFLKSVLPLLSFFAKKTNFIIAGLLGKLFVEPNILDLHKNTVALLVYCNSCISSVHAQYYTSIKLNALFYGAYRKDVFFLPRRCIAK